MEAYLDNSATTRCYGEVKDIVVKTMLEDYGNPSAMHTKGVQAEMYLKDAASKLARILKVTEKEILLPQGEQNPTIWRLLAALWQIKEQGTILSQLRWNMRQWRVP